MSESHESWSLGYAYLSDDGVTIIDPGTGTAANLERWRVFLNQSGRRLSDITHVLLTHGHADHLGLTNHLLAHTRAQVYLSRAEHAWLHGRHPSQDQTGGGFLRQFEAWGVPEPMHAPLVKALRSLYTWTPPVADHFLEDGQQLDLPGAQLTVVSVPGHTVGHVGFIDHHQRLFFSGDHVLPRTNPGIGSGSTPAHDLLTDFLDSLDAMRAYDIFEVLPGHEYRFTGLHARAQVIQQKHLRRATQIRDAWLTHPGFSIWDIASRTGWGRSLTERTPYAIHAVLHQTEIHVRSIERGNILPRLHRVTS